MLQEQSEQKQQTYIYEGGSYAPLARIDTEYEVDDIYYYHTDQIGTPLELTNEQGTIVWQANYKAWGEVDSFSINEIEQNLRYQGQYFDEETELHYNTFRYYDPQVGRFTTQDPIGLLGGNNLYSYAPNPVTWIDLLGLSDEKIGSESNPFGSSRAARRESMRQAGIPTSQQPTSQSRNSSGWEYSYEMTEPGGGKGTSSVQQQTMDVSHPDKPHWEAGKVKVDDNGSPRMSRHGRPQLRNGKGKAYYRNSGRGGC